MPSRRALLRAIGASTLGAIAGCSEGDRSNSESTTDTTPGATTAAEYQETTIMSQTSTTAAPMETATATGTIASEEPLTIDEERDATEETTEAAGHESNSGSQPSNGGSGNPSGGSGPTAGSTTEDLSGAGTASETDSTPATTSTDGTPTATTTRASTETTTERSPTSTTTDTPTAQPRTTTTTEPPTEQPPSEGGSWSIRTDLPTPQSNAGGGVVDGSLYCFGGIESGTNLPAVARTYRFDPDEEDGTWHRLEDAPRALWGPCGVAAEGKLYSFGGAPTDAPYGTGEPPSDEIFVYEPGEGWRDLTAETGVRCPYPNWAMSGAYDPDDGLVYLVGGGTDVTDRGSASDHGVGTGHPGTYDESRVWTFDPAAEEVANPDLTRLPAARRWPTVALVEVDGETCLQVICGLFGVTGPTDDNLRYRISADEWESMTPAPRSGCYATTSDPVIDGTIYLTHGFFWEDEPSVDSYTAACHAFDPVSDSFRTDFSSPRRLRGGAVDAVVDDTLYVVGGHVKRYDQNGYHDCKAATEAFAPPR